MAPAWSLMVAMETFIAKHAAKVQGTLSCFDRVLFRGYLPLMNGFAMADFLEALKIAESGAPVLVEPGACLPHPLHRGFLRRGRTSNTTPSQPISADSPRSPYYIQCPTKEIASLDTIEPATESNQEQPTTPTDEDSA